MKKLLAAIALFCVIGFAWKYTRPLSFTIETRDGQKIQVTKLHYDPSNGSDNLTLKEDFTLFLKFGSFKVHKDLRDIKRIEVVDPDFFGFTLKVTDTSGETIEGKRNGYSREYTSDWIRGESGKIHVFLSADDVVSITRN